MRNLFLKGIALNSHSSFLTCSMNSTSLRSPGGAGPTCWGWIGPRSTADVGKGGRGKTKRDTSGGIKLLRASRCTLAAAAAGAFHTARGGAATRSGSPLWKLVCCCCCCWCCGVVAGEVLMKAALRR